MKLFTGIQEETPNAADEICHAQIKEFGRAILRALPADRIFMLTSRDEEDGSHGYQFEAVSDRLELNIEEKIAITQMALMAIAQRLKDGDAEVILRRRSTGEEINITRMAEAGKREQSQ